jgi:hypothetical protein
MIRSWVRVVLAFAGVAALAASGALLWSCAARSQASDTSLRLAGDASRRALVDAGDLRAAQQAYVAAGQGEDFWFARVAALSTDLDDVLALFKSHLSSPEAFAAAGAAAAALENFKQLDRHVRDLTHTHQLAQASDAIFADGFELTDRLTWSIARAIAAETSAQETAAAESRRREAAALGAGAGSAALVLLLLAPVPTRKRAPETAVATSITLRELPIDTPERPVVAARPAAPVPAAQAQALDLAAVAALCGDLARVADTHAVQPLLERATALLDASGIVLWIADPDGRELSPIFVQGYPPRLANRLGTLSRDADNVTASAYRTGLLQSVKGDAVSNGALAAPLVTPAGCLGVMAVEMKNGGEQRAPMLAAATLIASQLSTLVGPPSTRRAEAAG